MNVSVAVWPCARSLSCRVTGSPTGGVNVTEVAVDLLAPLFPIVTVAGTVSPPAAPGLSTVMPAVRSTALTRSTASPVSSGTAGPCTPSEK